MTEAEVAAIEAKLEDRGLQVYPAREIVADMRSLISEVRRLHEVDHDHNLCKQGMVKWEMVRE